MEQKADLDWVTRFDEAQPRRSRSLALTLALGTLFGGGGLTAIALIVAALSRPAEEESGARASRTPSPAPTPTVVQTATQEPSMLPSGCGGLFSDATTVTLEQLGFELSSEYDGPWHAGSADAELRALLDDSELDCSWTDEKAALLTRIAEVDPDEQSRALARLEALDFTRLTENGGVRYFVERTEATGATGESHFFRDGLWFATHWIGHGQYGYTADMVRSVFD